MSDASARIRFLADEDFNQAIVAGLRHREPRLDMLTISELGMKGTPDPQVLAFAAEQGRMVVSHDVTTMPVHFAVHIAGGNSSPGLFVIHQTIPIGKAIEELLLIWEASAPEEWRDRWTRLPL